MQTEDNLAPGIPPATNPDVGRPTKKAGKPKAKTNRRPGTALVPDLATQQRGNIETFFYWVGVTPSCPVEHVDLAGINFPKVNELIVPDPMRGTAKRRVPVIGSIVRLSAFKLRQLEQRLRQTVVRFYDDRGVHEELGTGQNVGDNHVRPRRGQLITIPTPEETELRQRSGKPVRTYQPRPSDAPAARFIFAQLCTDQEKGNRGDFYPEVLETAGLEWPEHLES